MHGNEHADKAAKEAINIPLITEMPCSKVDITNIVVF